MDGPIEQPQEQTPVSQDDGWNNFVSQQSQKQKDDASDPKWQDFVQSHADQAKAPPPTTGEAVSSLIDPIIKPIASHILNSIAPSPPSAEEQNISDDAAKFRNSKDYKEGAANFYQLAQDAVIKPAVQSFLEQKTAYGQQVSLADQSLRESLSPYKEGELGPLNEPVTATLQKVMDVGGALASEASARVGLSGLVQTASRIPYESAGATPEEAQAMSQGFGSNISQIPLMLEGAMKTPGNPVHTFTQAKGAGVMDGEGAYFGTEDLPPERQAAIDAAQAASQPEAAKLVPDIHQVARNIAPETFDTYDRLSVARDGLRSQLTDLSAQRTADLDAQIKGIQDSKKGGYGKLQSLMAKRDDISSSDTPEMADIRQKLQDTDYQMRDLAPKVSEAYRSASEFVPQEEEKTSETENQPLKDENTQEKQPETSEVNPTSGKTLDEQHDYIINDFKQRAVAAGSTPELADAHAQLEVARYETLAQQYPKFSAEEWYDRESANIKAGKERARVLAQKGDIDELLANAKHPVSGRSYEEELAEAEKRPETNTINTPERQVLREKIANDMYGKGAKRKDGIVHIVTGAPGAGKTSAVVNGLVKKIGAIDIDPDAVKERLPEYDNGTGAAAVHKESQDIARRGPYSIMRKAMTNKDNMVLPVVGQNFKGLNDLIEEMKKEGYTVHIDHVDVSEENSLKRVIERFKETGRSVPLDYVKNANREVNNVHEQIKSNRDVAGTARIDNNGAEPRVTQSRNNPEIEGLFNSGRRRSGGDGRYDTKNEVGAGSQELGQGARGKIRLATDDAKATITLMKSANASTLIHEKGHEWTDQILRLSKEEDAPAKLKADAEALRKYGGASEDGVIPTRGHEKIARGFERYFMEGVAPSPALAGIFSLYKRLLTAIYKTVERLRSPISDDIRDVFDRFLSANPEKTVIAPDHEPGKMLADIHTADAEHTEPKNAAPVADNVRKEIKSTAQIHNDTEAANAINTAEQTGGSSVNPASPEPAPVNPSEGKSEKVGAGGNQTAPEGADIRAGTGPAGGDVAGNESGHFTTNPSSILAKPKPYFIDKKGVINFDLLKTPEDIQRYLQEWSEKNPDKISQARGGVITLDQTAKLAESMGMTPKDLLSRKVGELYDGPKQVAAAQLFIQSSKRIKEAADAARASGDPQAIIKFFADLEDHKDFMDMFLQQVGISAEASRALGARRAIRKLGGFDEAMQIGDLFQKMTGQNLKDAKVTADLFASLDSPAKVSRMAQKTREATWFDYAIAYRNNNLLSGPVTHMHYADGSIVNLLYKPLKVAAASIIPGGPSLGEAGAMYSSMVLGATKGLSAAKAAWQDGVDKSFQETVENYKRPTKVQFNPAFDKFFNVSSRAIGSVHSLFYTMRYEQEIAAQAFRKALSEGLEEKSDAFNNRLSDLQTSPTHDMMEYADKASKKEGYMENPEWGSALSIANQFANRTAVGRWLFPFAKMEMNVKKESLLNNTVLGVLSKDVRANLMGVNGPEARAIQIAGMAMGTSLAGLTWAASDYINGNGPSNPNERKVWLLTHTPNSVQIGNVAIPLRALGNVGQILMAGAEMREAFEDMSHDQANKTAAIFSEHVSRVAFEGTFIQGADSAVNAIFHPDQYGPQFLQNQVTGLIPYSTLLGQTNRYIDPFQREVHSEGLANLFGITDQVKARVPFASQTLQARVDVLGNPIPNDRWLAAGNYDKYISDPVVQKLNQIGAAIPKPKRNVMGVPLSDTQYHDYSVTAGALIKENLGWVLQSPNFDQMPRSAQLKEISRTIGEAHQQAGQELMFLNPDIMQKATQKKQAGMMQ